jgi:hypothetical protein
MRQKNWRAVIVGFVLIILAVAFYLFMLANTSRSNDPVALMRIVGTVSGVVSGLAFAMIVVGLIGKKV